MCEFIQLQLLCTYLQQGMCTYFNKCYRNYELAEIYELSLDKIIKLCWHIIHFITQFCCN